MNKSTWRNLIAKLPPVKDKKRLPPEWQDKVIASSRKGPLGAIKVRRFTGIMKNSASKTINQFEKNMGGDKDRIATLLEANPNLTDAEQKLIEFLRDPKNSKKSLARLVVESKTEPAKVITKASYGALLVGQAEAYVEIGQSMPRVVRELRRHVKPKLDMCTACQGKGMVPSKVNATIENITCPVCKGEKGILTTSDNFEFATEKLIEMSKMGKQPQAPMQVAIQNTNAGGGSLPPGIMERVVSLQGGLLFQKSLPQGVEEAEIVSSRDNSEEPSNL
jgi:hypothetical protein